MEHPLHQFRYCPQCGGASFENANEKARKCSHCGFVYYFNPAAAVACLVRDKQSGRYLFVRRGKEPAKGTLDLAGGFLDCHETAEDAVRREIKEETGLDVSDIRYLYSFPNIYPYAGFNVHTLDLFFECTADGFAGAAAADDAAEIVILPAGEVEPEAFGLASVRRGVRRYFGNPACTEE